MRKGYKIALVVCVALTVLALATTRRPNPELGDSAVQRQKVEALTDAVQNGLITPKEYAEKIRELTGEPPKDHAPVPHADH